MEQVGFPFDCGAHLADASGGLRSDGRTMLNQIRATPGMTDHQIAAKVRCSDEFVSLMGSGKRKPQRWGLRVRLERELGIPQDAWDRFVEDEPNHG